MTPPATERKRFPMPLVAAAALLAAFALLILLSWFGVGPFSSLGIFILSNVAGFFALLVLGVLGGAFVGMLVAHRIFSHQEFTPFERTMMESVTDLRNQVDALREGQKDLLARLEARDGETRAQAPRTGKRD